MKVTITTRAITRLAATTLVCGTSIAALTSPAWAGPSSFTSGDLVVSEVTEASGGPSSTAGVVSLVEFTTTGTLSGFSVTMPTADAGSTHVLVDSGSATNDGLLTASADGQYLYATGYDAAPGTLKITSATSTPRIVGITSSTGTVDSSTALTDATTEAQNFRSATGSTGGASSFYNGGGAGVGYTADWATSNALLDTTDNVHEVQIANGNLYASTTANIVHLGTGLPTSGTPTVANLIPSPPAGFSANGFAFTSLGGGSAPDTLYVADTGNNKVEKYSLVSGVWTATGSVTVADVTGLVVSISGGVASIYTTNAPAGSTNKFATVLSELTDGSGAGGTLPSGTTITTLATAGTNTSFHGLAWSPSAGPGNDLPEAPWVLLLPVAGALVASAAFFVTRRRHDRTGVAI